MSLPDFRELNTGDTNDDDPQVLDSLIQTQANPLPPLPDEITTPVIERPSRVTRMQSGRMVIQSLWEPVKLLNPDFNRKSLIIAMDSAVATDTIYVSDTSDSVRYAGSLFQANPLTLKDHTGAVWVYNPTGNPITVSYWAITM